MSPMGYKHTQQALEKNRDAHLTHGQSYDHLYPRWRSMMNRCYNEKSKKYPRYGGRGIVVCSEWHDPKQYIKYIGPCPFAGASIDRINVNGNYEPGNVRWTTQKTQQNNRVNNRIIEYKGIKKKITEWGEIYKINPRIIRQRLDRDGWEIEKALTYHRARSRKCD